MIENNLVFQGLKINWDGKNHLNHLNNWFETGPHRPMLQVDGQGDTLLEDISYTFKSEYGEEDICFSLAELFPPLVAQWGLVE